MNEENETESQLIDDIENELDYRDWYQLLLKEAFDLYINELPDIMRKLDKQSFEKSFEFEENTTFFDRIFDKFDYKALYDEIIESWHIKVSTNVMEQLKKNISERYETNDKNLGKINFGPLDYNPPDEWDKEQKYQDVSHDEYVLSVLRGGNVCNDLPVDYVGIFELTENRIDEIISQFFEE